MSDLDKPYADSPDAHKDSPDAYKDSPDAYAHSPDAYDYRKSHKQKVAPRSTHHGNVNSVQNDDGSTTTFTPMRRRYSRYGSSSYAWIGQAQSSDDDGSDVCFGAVNNTPGNIEDPPAAIENFAIRVSGDEATLDLNVSDVGAFLCFGTGSGNENSDYSTGPCVAIEADSDAVSIILTPESGNGATVTIDALASVFSSNSITAVDFFLYDPAHGQKVVLLGAPVS